MLTDDELNEIEDRAEEAKCARIGPEREVLSERVIKRDIPRLISEIRRLRAERT